MPPCGTTLSHSARSGPPLETDYAIIGGGVVGLSLAWGLLRRGRSVTVLDGSDGSFRASRGNFGLIWVQSKGLNEPRYARWSQRSAAAWADFAEELTANTGVDIALEQRGGYDFHFTEESLATTIASYEALRERLDGDYPFEVLGNNALRKEEPAIGPGVAGAILHHQDGHANPLRLLMALAADTRRLGGKVLNGVTVEEVTPAGAGSGNAAYEIRCSNGTIARATKVILSAGLGSIELGPRLGFLAPLRPQRGQVLITEKLPRLINRPSGTIRQVNEGGVQIGATNEEVGFDDTVTLPQMAALAADAARVFPPLANANMVRAWGALRILSRDGLPIYQESPQLPGVYLVTCHSGITLAAAHARLLPDWLEGSAAAPDLSAFSEARFAG